MTIPLTDPSAHARPLDRIAFILWIRANLCEKDWDGFIEVVGIPKWIVIMPPNVPVEKEAEYMAAAKTIANGGSGALPNGSDAKSPSAEGKGTGDVFRPRLDWLQEQLVLAGTGGLLSMLAMPTGMNDSQGAAHSDAFAQLGIKEARRISAVFNQQFDRLLLDAEHRSQPVLAKFELQSKEETDPAAIVKDVLSLSQAGYMVDAEQITQKTGYNVTLKPTPIPGSAGVPPAPDGVPPAGSKVQNRSLTPGPDSLLLKNAIPSIFAAKQRDLAPLFNRIQGIMELEDPRLMENALRKLQSDLRDPKSEIIQSAIKDPAAARAMANAMTPALLNGYAQGEASMPSMKSTPVRNRAILNMASDQPRDSLGKWVDENGGGLSVKDNIQRGNKAIDRAIRQKADVQKAMHRKEAGQIDFKWGTPGDKDNDYAGGHGISHVMAKHGEADARKLPIVIAKGKITPHPEGPNKLPVTHENYEASLARKNSRSAWVLTGFTRKVK